MVNLLEELKTIPGVVGGYFISQKKGFLASNMPAMFKEPKLLDISRQLVKIYSAGRMNFPDISDTFLHYEEMVLVVKMVSPQLYLMVFCDSAVNTNMLAMSINLSLESLPEIDNQAQAIAQPGTAPTAAAELTVATVMESPDLAEPLRQMSQGLAQVMGPMSELIFEESLQEWLNSGQVGVDKMPELLKIIKEEIGDQQKSKEYQNLVVALLQP